MTDPENDPSNELAKTLPLQRGAGAELGDEKAPSLVVLRGVGRGRRIALRGESWLIGRLPECEVRIDSPSVSKRHACIRLEGGAFWIEDLGSTNGVAVNDTDLSPDPRRLCNGDTIRLSDQLLLFHRGSNHAVETSPIRIDKAAVAQEAARLLGDMPGLRNARSAR